MKSWYKSSDFWVIAFCLATLLLFSGIYWYHFPGRIINENNAWADFASFFSLPVGVVNAVGVIYLGYKVYLSQKLRDEFEFEKARPDLYFIGVNGNYYDLYNFGGGTARNVIVGKQPMELKGIHNEFKIETPTILCYSIPPNGHLDLQLITHTASKLYATYTDGKEQYLILIDGENSRRIDNPKLVEFLKTNAKRTTMIRLRL